MANGIRTPNEGGFVLSGSTDTSSKVPALGNSSSDTQPPTFLQQVESGIQTGAGAVGNFLGNVTQGVVDTGTSLVKGAGTIIDKTFSPITDPITKPIAKTFGDFFDTLSNPQRSSLRRGTLATGLQLLANSDKASLTKPSFLGELGRAGQVGLQTFTNAETTRKASVAAQDKLLQTAEIARQGNINALKIAKLKVDNKSKLSLGDKFDVENTLEFQRVKNLPENLGKDTATILANTTSPSRSLIVEQIGNNRIDPSVTAAKRKFFDRTTPEAITRTVNEVAAKTVAATRARIQTETALKQQILSLQRDKANATKTGNITATNTLAAQIATRQKLLAASVAEGTAIGQNNALDFITKRAEALANARATGTEAAKLAFLQKNFLKQLSPEGARIAQRDMGISAKTLNNLNLPEQTVVLKIIAQGTATDKAFIAQSVKKGQLRSALAFNKDTPVQDLTEKGTIFVAELRNKKTGKFSGYVKVPGQLSINEARKTHPTARKVFTVPDSQQKDFTKEVNSIVDFKTLNKLVRNNNDAAQSVLGPINGRLAAIGVSLGIPKGNGKSLKITTITKIISEIGARALTGAQAGLKELVELRKLLLNTNLVPKDFLIQSDAIVTRKVRALNKQVKVAFDRGQAFGGNIKEDAQSFISPGVSIGSSGYNDRQGKSIPSNKFENNLQSLIDNPAISVSNRDEAIQYGLKNSLISLGK